MLSHDHPARAYFLAFSCIEEAGKSLFSFDSQHRNLNDPAVCTKLRRKLEDHEAKIGYALMQWALGDSEPTEGIQKAIVLIGHLARGREASLYTDIRSNPDRAQLPKEVVRKEAAANCVQLAANCLAYAKRHLNEKAPTTFSSAQNTFFTMKSGKARDLLNEPDFWWYFIWRKGNGDQDLSEAVVGYTRDYLSKDRLFRQVD